MSLSRNLRSQAQLQLLNENKKVKWRYLQEESGQESRIIWRLIVRLYGVLFGHIDSYRS